MPFSRPTKRRRISKKAKKPGGAEEVLSAEIRSVRSNLDGDTDSIVKPFERFEQVNVKIVKLGSHGEGIGFTDNKRIVVVPFCLPEETVVAKVYHEVEDPPHALADLVQVVTPSEIRDESLIGCKYFGKCSGCQFQQISYTQQLKQKQLVVREAFERHMSIEESGDIDAVQGSPLQYGYRTKITPHFNDPKGEDLAIGFETKGRRKILDIEECPIATKTLNEALVKERFKVKEKIHTFRRGATLLLRESFDKEEKSPVCITDHKATVTELVGKHTFEFPAGSFFQNNNSILPLLTSYVHSEVQKGDIKHLVDTYCGAGFFACTSSSQDNKGIWTCPYETIHAIEVSPQSIDFAKRNASLNHLPLDKTFFHLGSAEAIFDKLGDIDGSASGLIIDPPRKGCDDVFLDQVLAFGPARIVYVSCNVHTQARDVKYLVDGNAKLQYKVEKIRPFDLFPQTYHVESVATLIRIDLHGRSEETMAPQV